jgi:hypothetical protein
VLITKMRAIASAPVNSDPGFTGTELSAATSFEGVQVGVIETYQGFGGTITHSILRDSTGSFDRFQGVSSVVDWYGTVGHLSMTSWAGEMQLAFSTPDGQLFHTIRDYQGDWQNAGDVDSVAGNVTAGQVTIAGINYY